jgi:hypothetical protein
MTIRTGLGFMKTIRAARGNGLILALALAGVGIQGCSTGDSPVSPVTETSPPAELAEAAQTASSSGTQTVAKNLGGGCTLHAIIADAGSRVRGNAWITCDNRHSQIGFLADLAEMPHGKVNHIQTVCRNVYWCGTGDLYVPDHSGIQKYDFWVAGNVDGNNHEVTVEGKY